MDEVLRIRISKFLYYFPFTWAHISSCHLVCTSKTQLTRSPVYVSRATTDNLWSTELYLVSIWFPSRSTLWCTWFIWCLNMTLSTRSTLQINFWDQSLLIFIKFDLNLLKDLLVYWSLIVNRNKRIIAHLVRKIRELLISMWLKSCGEQPELQKELIWYGIVQ